MPASTPRAPLTVLPVLPPLAQWKLLEGAFEAMRAPDPVTFVPLAGGLAACVMSGHAWGLVWLLLMAGSIAWAQRLAGQFEMRGAESLPEEWARRLTAAYWYQAAAIGAGGLIAAAVANPALSLLLACAIGFAMAQTAATAAFTLAIRGQVLLLAAPIALACLINFTPFMAIAGLMLILQALAAVSLADRIIARTHAVLAGDRSAGRTVPPGQFSMPPSAADFQKLLGRDQTTGLPNRHSFMNLLAQECVRAGRAETHLSVLLLQWDDYASQHTTEPQPVVDKQLAHMARRLRTTLRRPADLIASLGAGRFAVILPFTDAFGGATVARNLQSALALPELNADGMVTAESTRLSIGAATYCGLGVLPEGQLLEFAEEALAAARGNGGNRINRYDPVASTPRPPAYTGPYAQEPAPHAAAFVE
jgi:diguanylate cyclase (GGDEF)-like protein